MRQTGKTSRTANHVVDQLFQVGQCITTDHVVFEVTKPKKKWLGNLIRMVENQVTTQSNGAKIAKSRIVKVDSIPCVHFTMHNANNQKG